MIEKAKKRGNMSMEDRSFIRSNILELSIQEIADALNRTTGTVEKFIKKEGLVHTDVSSVVNEKTRLLTLLNSKPYWSQYKKQFLGDEITFFEDTWIAKMQQFRENIMYTEEESMADTIRIQILINRSMVERRIYEEDIASLGRLITDEKLKPDDEIDLELISNLENQLAFAKSSVTNYSGEYKNLLGEKGKLDKGLKATRDERVKTAESGKDTWTSYLKMMEDEETKEQESRSAELLRMATDKAQERLSEYHEFGDGMVDRPFLLPETVTEEDL